MFGEHAIVEIGESATETLAKAEAPHVDVIHIATHFQPNVGDPLSSALNLYPTAVDDGNLMVREVMDLELAANLVTLSSCSTNDNCLAFDDAPNSDDWVSLTRAFIYAGTPSVVATLWPINDQASATFMSRFYALLPQYTKSESVSMAQRDLLAAHNTNPRYRDPYYWAPFVLVGSGR